MFWSVNSWPTAKGADSCRACPIREERFSSNHFRICDATDSVMLRLVMLRLPVGVSGVGLARSGSNSPWVAGIDIAGGSSASIFDDTGWISVEGPACLIDGGRPKVLERTVTRTCLAQVVETPIPVRQGVGPMVVGYSG